MERPARERFVLHVDLDAFFAQVEQRDHPEWRGKPVVVGADPQEGRGRGVVSTASYEARAFGVGSGMPISQAWRLLEGRGAVFVHSNWGRYGEASRGVMRAAAAFSDVFEQAGIDEAYLELGGVRGWWNATALGRELKAAVWEAENLTCTVGVAPNKLLSKMVVAGRKPDGLGVVRQEETLSFLSGRPVSEIPGVGPRATLRLHGLGVRTIEQLRDFNPVILAEEFGSYAAFLRAASMGLDERPVGGEWAAKSRGQERTFPRDVPHADALRKVYELARDVFEEIEADATRFRVVEAKVRFAGFETVMRQRRLRHPSARLQDLQKTAEQLAFGILAESPKKLVRLVGVRATGLESFTGQLKLEVFSGSDPQSL